MPPNNRLPASPGNVDANTGSAGTDTVAVADADADLARAFQELAKGERTASAMETQLTALERKIDDLLATVASADAQALKVDKAITESTSHVFHRGEDQSKQK